MEVVSARHTSPMVSNVDQLTAEYCPRCSAGVAKVGRGDPWCPECEWNLDAFPASPGRKVSRRERREHQRAFRLDRQMFEQLRSMPPGPPKRTSAGLFLILVSVALYVLDLGLVVGGVWLVINGFFVWKLLGVLLVLLGLELRPRVPKGTDDPLGTVTPDAVPELFSLVREVCGAAAGPVVETIIVTPEFNAACRRVGLRRRPELSIGLPLWASLEPQSRVALLGHEVGHLVNGDPEHGSFIQPVFTTFAVLARVSQPDRLTMSAPGGSLVTLLSSILAQVLFRPISWGAKRIHFWLFSIAARDHQRAEYYADAISARLAGSDAAQGLFRRLVRAHVAYGAIQRVALDSADPHLWRAAVVQALDDSAHDEPLREQLSRRNEASPYAGHPPSGYRAQLLREWPNMEAQLVLSPSRSDLIDQQLAQHWTRVRKAVNQAPHV